MARRLLQPLCLALATLVWACGPALADQPLGRYQDARLLIATARCYTPAQKVKLEEELARTLAAKVSPVTLAQLTQMALMRAVPAEHLSGFYQALRRVRAVDGLPEGPFAAKMAEGLAKGAPAELILQVVLERERHYLQARQLMMSNVRHQALYDRGYYRVMDLTAEALRRGLPAQGLARIFQVRNSSLEEMGRAVGAYLYMQAIGFPPDVAPDILVAALEAGEFQECRACLSQVIFSAKRAGAPPRKVRDDLVRGLRSGHDLGELARVLYAVPGNQ